MEPSRLVTSLINAYFTYFHEGMWEDSCKSEQSKALKKLLDPKEKGVRYDAQDYNADYLIRTFTPYADHYSGNYKTRDEFSMFLQRLNVLGIWEQGGISALNQRIAEIIAELRAVDLTTDEAKANTLANEYYGIIDAAIYLFPAEARSLEITLHPDKLLTEDTFNERYLRSTSIGGEREWYRRLHDALLKEEQATNPIRVHLPYGFTTGTHGSGERAARGQSVEEIELTTISRRNERKSEIAFGVALNEPLLFFDYTRFLLEEIAEIKLSEKTELTPFVKEGRNWQEADSLQARWNWIQHYLRFRDFALYQSFRNREAYKNISDDEWQYLHNISEPGFNSALWNTTYTVIGTYLNRGFFAVYSANPDEVTLYEIENVRMPDEDDHVSAGHFALKIVRNDERFMRRHVKVYRGEEIVHRLAQIPVRPRNF